MRVTRVTRDLISAGFVVLLPAYASLTRRNERALLIRLMQSSLLAVVVPGAVLQTVLLLVADRALSMWLGEIPEGLLNVIGLLALWNFLTIVNVPFWYWLLATGHQREAAKSVWLHTVTLISLYPLGHLVELNVAMCAVVWTLGSVATQARIYYYIQSRSDFLKSVLSRFTCFMLLAGVGLLTSAAWWTNRSERPGTAQEQGVEVTIGTLTVVYLVVFLVYVAKSRFIDYLLPSRGVSV